MRAIGHIAIFALLAGPSDSSSRLSNRNLCHIALLGPCWKASGPRPRTPQILTTGDLVCVAKNNNLERDNRHRNLRNFYVIVPPSSLIFCEASYWYI